MRFDSIEDSEEPEAFRQSAVAPLGGAKVEALPLPLMDRHVKSINIVDGGMVKYMVDPADPLTSGVIRPQTSCNAGLVEQYQQRA
jgi:hypothetical protein